MARVWPRVDAVVIGASAGGIDALLALLPHWPADAPATLVVVHRQRQHDDDALATLLGRRCPAQVAEAWDREPLRPGHVLLAPADYHLMVDPGPVVALSIDAPVLWSRPAIDPLFESAALRLGPRLLAIVLTGASADGARGAQAVRAAGGELWVQDPQEAAVSLMPRSAIEAAGADRVLALADMAQALRTWRPRGVPPP